MRVHKREIRGRVYTLREMTADKAAEVNLRLIEAVGERVFALAAEAFGGGKDAAAVLAALMEHPEVIGAVAAKVAKGLRPHLGEILPLIFEGVTCDRCRLGTDTGAEGPAELGGAFERWKEHFAGAQGMRDLLPVAGWVLAANFLAPSTVESLFAGSTPPSESKASD